MEHMTRLRRGLAIASSSALVFSAAWVLLASGGSVAAKSGQARASAQASSYAAAELIGGEENVGAMCQPVAMSAQQILLAALTQQGDGGAASPSGPAGASGGAQRSNVVNRPPLRVVRDPLPTFSAVTLDKKNGEIILQDENLFQILFFDRTTNTPVGATMSEPKRQIGGAHTEMEFNCALYVDPNTGEVYSVNNDTIDQMTVWSRDQRGDHPASRQLETPHGSYGIAVDEAAQEMFLTVQHAASVVVYNKMASGRDKPIRMISGNKTGIADPHGISLDTKHGWMFVANYGNASLYEPGHERDGGGGTGGAGRILGSGRFYPPSITVYGIKSDGDVAPLRTITGSQTGLNWPAHLYVDEDHGDLYVANDGSDAILVFKVTDDGNVAPSRVIKGSKTEIKNPTGVVVDNANDELIVANMGNHRATVYHRDANGDVPPIRRIRAGPEGAPALQIGNPGAVAYDTKRDEILVPN